MADFNQREYILESGWVQIVSGNSSLGWKDPQSGSIMSLSMAVATQKLRDNNTAIFTSKETEIHISNEEQEEKEETKKKRRKKNTESKE